MKTIIILNDVLNKVRNRLRSHVWNQLENYMAADLVWNKKENKVGYQIESKVLEEMKQYHYQ